MKLKLVNEALFAAVTGFSTVFTACYFAAELGDYEFDFQYVSILSLAAALGTLLGKLSKAWPPKRSQDA